MMKIMAGYDTRHKTDYRAKAAEEVAKVQQKAKILEEMLQSIKPGDKIAEGDVFEVCSRPHVILRISCGTDGVQGTCKCPPKCPSKNPEDVRGRVR